MSGDLLLWCLIGSGFGCIIGVAVGTVISLRLKLGQAVTLLQQIHDKMPPKAGSPGGWPGG
jgi:type III secretory pathway component EscS